MTDLSNQAYQYLQECNYLQAQELYGRLVEKYPEIVTNYYYLGLVYLLQNQEEEAQGIWLSILMENPELTTELVTILNQESEKLESRENNEPAWLIRQYIREFAPEDINNLIILIQLSLDLGFVTDLENLCSELLQLFTINSEFNYSLIVNLLQKLIKINPQSEITNNLALACISYGENNGTFKNILIAAFELILIAEKSEPNVIIKIGEILLNLQSDLIPAFVASINAYTKIGKFKESIEIAEIFLHCSDNLLDQIAAYYLTIKSLLTYGGEFSKARELNQEHIKLINQLIHQPNLTIENKYKYTIIAITYFLSYFEDNPQQTNYLRQNFSSLFQQRIEEFLKSEGLSLDKISYDYEKISNNQKLKIGYLSGCFYRHSVGQLSRWLIQYHDLDNFEIYAYSLESRNDEIQNLFKQVTQFRDISNLDKIEEIVKLIQQDQINILVDLDSLTSPKACAVLALKPAPIQVSWLGFDSSGLPSIDYFIADSYALPANAQDYYTETIWRLPNSFIAVNGFKVGVTTLHRYDLNIPHDAIVYLSSQTGYKRHPENIKLQMQIIKQVPNSYFLIKSWNSDLESFKQFFLNLAEIESISGDRLRFLPVVTLEETHRANLKIADIVLDTYPYNGATTTLETLWMGIPLVTRVGEQFAARNSYTMMINAGITEGIAWSDEEYLEWGIKLGLDEELRKNISWKLKQSKQTSPLWNAKEFTKEMEKAYTQMWQRYLDS